MTRLGLLLCDHTTLLYKQLHKQLLLMLLKGSVRRESRESQTAAISSMEDTKWDPMRVDAQRGIPH